MSRKKTWFLTGDDFPEDFIEEFVAIAVTPPIFVSDLDLKHFCRLVLGTLSLSLEEKTKVLDSLPTLSSFQCDELERTFTEEIEEFSRLSHEYPSILRLSAGMAIGTSALALHRGAGVVNATEETTMIRGMGAAKRKSSRRLQNFLKDMPIRDPIVDYVYGESQLSHAEIPDWLRKGI